MIKAQKKKKTYTRLAPHRKKHNKKKKNDKKSAVILPTNYTHCTRSMLLWLLVVHIRLLLLCVRASLMWICARGSLDVLFRSFILLFFAFHLVTLFANARARARPHTHVTLFVRLIFFCYCFCSVSFFCRHFSMYASVGYCTWFSSNLFGDSSKWLCWLVRRFCRIQNVKFIVVPIIPQSDKD